MSKLFWNFHVVSVRFLGNSLYVRNETRDCRCICRSKNTFSRYSILFVFILNSLCVPPTFRYLGIFVITLAYLESKIATYFCTPQQHRHFNSSNRQYSRKYFCTIWKTWYYRVFTHCLRLHRNIEEIPTVSRTNITAFE